MRAIGRADSVWEREKVKKLTCVTRIATEHGGPVIWAGHKYFPVRCHCCEWRHSLFDLMAKNLLVRRYVQATPIKLNVTYRPCNIGLGTPSDKSSFRTNGHGFGKLLQDMLRPWFLLNLKLALRDGRKCRLMVRCV